jgi:hypothetical protein
VFIFLASRGAWGQTNLATLTGIVTDPTGAVVPNVTVSATQVEAGTTVTAVTSEAGLYTIPQLRVGEYSVTVEQTGFKKFTRSGIILAASQSLRLDITLELGATTESVTITAESSLLKTDGGMINTNLVPAQIRNLPLLPVGTFIRDPFALSNTIAGVQQTFVGTRINGLGQTSIQYRMDGEILGEPNGQGSVFPGITTRTQPSPDAVEEMAVLTSNIPVEFGSASGGVYNISIKSGTNQYHGTVYDYAVNEVLNAYDPASHTRNRVRRNDYGFSIGGPVRIPKLYDGRNKTFFFFNWEQYRDTEKQYATTTPTVPTDAYRNGDFSGLFAASGNTVLMRNGAPYIDPLSGSAVPLGTLYDPNSTQQIICPAGNSGCTAGQPVTVRSPYTNNQIPTTSFDSVAVATLNKYVPHANLPGLINNYRVPIPTSRITSSPALKADQNLGSRMRLSFTYSENKTTSAVQALGGLAEGFPEPVTRNTGTYEAAPAFRLNFDYTIRPTINWHFGIGYSTYKFFTAPVTQDYNALTDIGLAGATANKNFPLFNLGGVTTPAIGGLNTLGTGGQNGYASRRPSITQSLTWVSGNHTMKFGADFRQDMLPLSTYATANGSYSFGGGGANTGSGLTWNPALFGLNGFTGNTDIGFNFANFMLGGATSALLSQPIEYRRSKQQWGIYMQDSWRIRRNLTIDAGIRWDYGTYAKEDYGRLGALSLSVPNSSASGRPGGLIYEATCNCHFAQNYPYAIGPRLGIAYTLNPKTVIRGGIGLAYGSTPVVSGVAVNSATTNSVSPGNVAFYLKDGIPSYVQPVWPNYSTGLGLPVGSTGLAPTLIDPNAGRPDRTIQWNLSLQREITRDLVVEAAYVANRGAWQSTAGFQDWNAVSPQYLSQFGLTVGNVADGNLLQTIYSQANPATLASHGITLPYSNFPTTTSTVLQAIKAYPQYTGAIAPSAPLGKSWYDALQTTITKRFSHGLQLTANYTWSKNTQWQQYFDVFNPTNGKDIVAGNPPNLLRINFVYQTPRPSASIPVLGNKYVGFALKDWQLGASMTYQSGAYLGRPVSTGANPISRWLGRGPGSAQLKQNPDGSYMSPWSVDWYDLNGVHHTNPLDINCKCFDPNKTQVLNPAAWVNVPDGQWAAQTQQLPFFRASRRPTEAANLARNFRMGPEGKYALQVRVEFQNIFNRQYLPVPGLGGATGASTPVTYGPLGITSGFGTFGNLNTANAYGGVQRSGQFIARFSF